MSQTSGAVRDATTVSGLEDPVSPFSGGSSGASAGAGLLGPVDIQDLAGALGIRPTKTLGQNFVHDAGTLRRIVRRAGVLPGETVLEIGPGLGSLTLALLEAGARVIAVGIEPQLARALPAIISGPAGTRSAVYSTRSTASGTASDPFPRGTQLLVCDTDDEARVLAAAVAVAGQTGGESLSELALRAGRAGADMRTLALSGPDAEPDAVADAISSLLRPDDELLTVILGRDQLNERLKKLVVVNNKVIKPYHPYIDAIDLRYHDGFSVRWKAGVRPVTTDNASAKDNAKGKK